MIDRETLIERSVEAYARHQLFDIRHYPADKVVFLDSYPTNDRMRQPLDRNYIAVGFSADDGGRQAELGSSLTRRLYTTDFYVFGLSRVWGRNLAGVLRASLEADKTINLLDPMNNDAVIGYVNVEFVSAQQAVTRDPRPWEENAFITRLRVEDYYSSESGG